MKKNTARLMSVLCIMGIFGAGQTVLAEGQFSYADLADYNFCFSSGVGSWSTDLTVNEDGTFQGNYHDTDMGDSGAEYPNGTRYVSNFSGKFTEMEAVSSYAYMAQIEYIQCEETPGTTEISDGMRIIYSEPYGMDHAENILFYKQGAPAAELPQGYLNWVQTLPGTLDENNQLCFPGIYNEAAEEGFFSTEKESSEISASGIDAELEQTAARAAELESRLSTEQDLAAMTELSNQLFFIWDDQLNSMWQRIKTILPAADMERLRDEELDWIAEKEAAVAAAGTNADASMRALIENGKAAAMTRDRVYVLAEYLR